MRAHSIGSWSALLLLVASSLHAGCPEGTAGKLIAPCSHGFEWYAYVGVHQFGPHDQVVFDFSVVPFSAGTMTVGADEDGGGTAYQVLFANGVVSNAGRGDLVPILSYTPGAWNDVRVVFDIESQSSVITVNGVSSEALPFNMENVQSLQSFRVNLGDTRNPAEGWLDSIRLVHRTESENRSLFDEDFEAGVPTLYNGIIEPHPSSEGGNLPPGCGGTTTAVEPAAWGHVKAMFR